MSDPLVTIVIPVFNGANYLAQAIDSALAQTYPRVEVLVVDDGSGDGGATRTIAEAYGPRIRYLHKRNGGVGSALDLGIQEMGGELFSWLSHDDLYKPGKVGTQVAAWRRFARSCVVIGDFELMDEEGTTIGQMSAAGHNFVARPLDAVFGGLINGCALLVPRELFGVAGMFEPGLPTTQDYHLWYRLARLVPFVHCPHADVRQRVHPQQGSRHPSHLDEASRMFAHLIDRTPAEVMRAYEGSELRFLQKIRRTLVSYPGVQAYLQTRVDRLLRNERCAVVLAADGPGPRWAAAFEALRRLSPPVAEVVAIDRDAAGGAGRTVADAVIPAGTATADVLRAGAAATTAAFLAFAHSARPPSPAQLHAALSVLFEADADLVRPRGLPSSFSPLEGLLVRRNALSRLADRFEAGEPDGVQSGRSFRVAEYACMDPLPSDPAAELSRALAGELRLEYDRSISESTLARGLAGPLQSALPCLLFLSHCIGGGTQTRLERLVEALAGKVNALLGYGAADGTLRLARAGGMADGGLVFHLPGQLADLVRLLRRIGLVRVDVQHTFGFEEMADRLLDTLALPFDVTLLDYHLIAKHPHLCLSDGRFAGDERLCDPDAGLLRPQPLPVLRKAARVIAISRDLAARTEALCPGLPIVCAQPCTDPGLERRHVLVPRLWGSEPLRVLVVGANQPQKGSELVLAAAALARQRCLPIRIHVMGELGIMHARRTADDALLLHGRFEAGRFFEVLGGIAPHVGWIPSQAPETWSYVLSDLMAASLPIAANAIGALPERCFGRPATWLLPRTSSAEDWVEFFLRLHATVLRLAPRWVSTDALPPAVPFFFDSYLHPMREAHAALPAMRAAA